MFATMNINTLNALMRHCFVSQFTLLFQDNKFPCFKKVKNKFILTYLSIIPYKIFFFSQYIV